MSNVLKNYIFRKIEKLIEEFMVELYQEFDIRTGEVGPIQALYFETTEKRLASIICELMEQNCCASFDGTWDKFDDITSNVGIDTLLRGFLQKETEFRLKEWFELPSETVTDSLISKVSEALFENAHDVVSIDKMDSIIYEQLKEEKIVE